MHDLVAVGHSVGGLLAKMLVQESGEALWNGMFRLPLAELEIAPDDRQDLLDTMFFTALPYVSREVFLATPHRGAAYADTLVGWLSAVAMRLPARYERRQERLRARNPGVARDDSVAAPPSVRLLSPAHPVMQALAALPIPDPVACHTIVGDSAGDASDGYVDYRSSHLPQAISECIVPSGHRANGHPMAVAEILRILHLHLVTAPGPVAPRGAD
jgi:hypothetical protein